MKRQGKTPQDQINYVEISKLLQKEFRVMIAKMIQTLKKEWRKCKNHLTHLVSNQYLEEIKNEQTVANNIVTDTKNTLEGINNRITEAEERK